MPIDIEKGINKGGNMLPEATPGRTDMQNGIAAAGAGIPQEGQTRYAQDRANEQLELLLRLPADAPGAAARLGRAMRMAEAHTAQTEASVPNSQP